MDQNELCCVTCAPSYSFTTRSCSRIYIYFSYHPFFYNKNNGYVCKRTHSTCNKLKLTIIIYKSYSRATVTSNFIAQHEEDEPCVSYIYTILLPYKLLGYSNENVKRVFALHTRIFIYLNEMQCSYGVVLSVR